MHTQTKQHHTKQRCLIGTA